MRKDMGKVITERERTGNPCRNAKTRMSVQWKGHDADYDIPNRMSSSANRQFGYDAKQFTDVLGPIYRYLDKQVGRPWNKVHSELCEHLDKRKVTHKHVFDHIENYVERNVYKGKDGIWYHTDRGYRFNGEDRATPVVGLFVNPKSGLIQRQKKLAEKPAQKDFDLIKINENRQYRRVDGIWYLCDGRPMTEDERDLYYFNHREREKFKILKKKQLSSKELKQLGLENIRDKNYNPKDGPNKKEYKGVER